ncbi:hypothetical protein VNI00_011229 [Paramarasmius palmivorus]|uniref:Major facilitator superfamily (MFS) profile domain-containing protein n=1 Tax=Paramarasmius palmivorus TaxID=297713 RepID=A0AAW0CD14_9AGAR
MQKCEEPQQPLPNFRSATSIPVEYVKGIESRCDGKIEHGEKDEDEGDEWESDPDNPRNWSAAKKWTTVAVVSLYALISTLSSSMMAPGLPDVAHKYSIQSETVLALTLSIFMLSFAVGPLFLAPLSEMYGRTWVYHIANMFSIAFSLGCAFSPSTGSLIAFRFMSGFSGAVPMAIGGGSVSDLFSEKDRAPAMACYVIGPLLGPAISPIASGYITQAFGIKWVFIAIAGACGFASLVGLPFLRETYAPVIRMKKAKKLRKPYSENVFGKPMSKGHFLWINLSRPIVLLSRSFICFVLSLYVAFLYGIYYLMFTTFAALFSETYGFGIGAVGLTYLGLGVGFSIGTLAGTAFASRMYRHLARTHDGKGTPEMRMPALFLGSLFCPIGLFWYGWSAAAKLHWIMPIVGSGIFALGMNCA